MFRSEKIVSSVNTTTARYKLSKMHFLSLLNSMCRVQARISQGLELLQFFTTRKWDFRTEQFYAVGKELSDKDLEMYGDVMFLLELMFLCN